LTAATERIDAHWSQFLGVSTSALRKPGVVVTPHAGLRDYRGVWFFVRGSSAIISAPPEWLVVIEQNLGSFAAEEILSPDSAVRVLGHASGEIVGPSFQGWLSADGFRPVASHGVRRLREFEGEFLQDFRSSCSPEDWDHGGIDPKAADVWSSSQESRVVALGQLRPQFDGSVDPCVITQPEYRSRGHALRLVSAMSEEALSEDRLVLYQTLISNAPAVFLALRLGFAHYATRLAVRLTPDAG
jgi:ribosomal protein S18 acetylase RimI-like enzyme